jgi:hypothetical protein
MRCARGQEASGVALAAAGEALELLGHKPPGGREGCGSKGSQVVAVLGVDHGPEGAAAARRQATVAVVDRTPRHVI